MLNILRVGCLQLLFMDKIPQSAAVNEAVKSAKNSGAAYAAGFINAVLRKVAAAGVVLPEEKDNLNYLSVRYSCPPELIKHFISAYGDEKAVQLLKASAGRRPLFIRLNTLICDYEQLRAETEKDGAEILETELENCFILKHAGDITELSAFKKGLFHVQDMSSQICCKVLDAHSGDVVLDACAAPGGKSFTTAQYMKGEGKIYACDIHPHKIRLISQGAQRLGISCIETLCADAAYIDEDIRVDRVLCDVPCSGLGVIGRKPEIKYKTPEFFAALPDTQYAVLQNCSRFVKSGGVLVYSTCTLNPAENEIVCEKFLSLNPEFSAADDSFYASLRRENSFACIFPSECGGDGFFISKFVKG